MNTVIQIINFIVSNYQAILTGVIAVLTGVTAIALVIPGPQPEAFLQGVTDFLTKFSKK